MWLRIALVVVVARGRSWIVPLSLSLSLSLSRGMWWGSEMKRSRELRESRCVLSLRHARRQAGTTLDIAAQIGGALSRSLCQRRWHDHQECLVGVVEREHRVSLFVGHRVDVGWRDTLTDRRTVRPRTSSTQRRSGDGCWRPRRYRVSRSDLRTLVDHAEPQRRPLVHRV